MSGLPVQVEHLEQYRAEWTAGFDAVKAECGENMLAMQPKLQALEDALMAKYSTVGEVQLPTSARGWRKLTEAFMAPIMVAQSAADPKEYVLVVVDTQMQ